MSVFHGQRLANNYPHWTKIRKDPSSLGQRMFSTFGEYLEYAKAEAIRLKDSWSLFKHHLGLSHLFIIWLDENDYIPTTTAIGGALLPTYPAAVVGTHTSLGDITLTRDETFEELVYGAPTRLTLNSTIAYTNKTIWESNAPNTFQDMPFAERLVINVDNSTLYKKRTRLKNRLYSGNSQITLFGIDINRNPIRETIKIRDDGVYHTRHFFLKLTERPEVDGFNGDITIGYKQAAFPYVLDMYRTAVMPHLEGSLKLKLEVDTESYLVYFTDELKSGAEYRDGDVDFDNEVIIGKQVLRDVDGLTINAVDLVVSPENTKLYVVDDSGFVHVYDHGFNSFTIPASSEATRQTRIILQPIQPYATYGQTETVFTEAVRIRERITHAIIKRIKPDATVEYLQSDKTTWGVAPYEFLGALDSPTIERSWQDFRFDIEYDQLGQWDLYIEVVSGRETTIAHTAVMVDSIDALVSIESEVGAPEDIFFGMDGRLVISDNTSYYKFDENKDTYLANVADQNLLFRENYSSIEVTY